MKTFIFALFAFCLISTTFASASEYDTLCIAARTGDVNGTINSLQRLGRESVQNGYEESAPLNSFLCEHGTVLSEAVFAGQTAVIQSLLSNPKINVNSYGRVDIDASAQGETWMEITPLGIASYLGNLQIMKLLLAAPGIDVVGMNENRAQDDTFDTPVLTAAVYGNQLFAVKLLLTEPGIRKDVVSVRFGKTALQIAADKGYKEIINLL